MVDTSKVILAKKEATYNVDPAPTAAANAVLTRNFRTSPVESDTLDRNLDVSSRGALRTAVTNRRQTIEYEVELAGSGAAGTAAAWMELLEGCGMAAPVLTAATKAEQKFAAAGVALSSIAHHHWKATQRRRGLGSRGTFGLTFAAGAYPFARLAYTALLPAGAPVDTLAPTAPTLTRWKEPVEVNLENTDFTLDGFAPAMKELTIDAEAAVALRSLVGARYVTRGNHKLNFRAVIEAPELAAKNYWSLINSEVVLALTHGTVAGNIVELAAARAQILKIDESEEDDVLMMTISGQLNILAGADDLVLTAK